METFLVNLMQKGGISALLLALGLLWMNEKIKDLKVTFTAQIEELKKEKRWTETCEKTHEEVNRRFERLEASQNGGGG